MKEQRSFDQPTCSLQPDTQRGNIDVYKKEEENPIWGTFHFIAKPEQYACMQSNTTGIRRTLSPVVDSWRIPQEVLEDIYGGKSYYTA